MKRLIRILAIVLSLLLSACAISSGERIQRIASEHSFDTAAESAGGFSMFIARNTRPLDDDQALHIYLEGDGLPWQFRYVVSPDPTPRHPLMMNLMALDGSAAYYVGRPCYNGFAEEAACHPKLWTSSRHADEIVAAMAELIRRLAEQSGAKRLRLFGHSGGGTMAMLLAARLPNVELIVSLAGNLDITGWTRLHNYSPLYGSLNPATQPVLPARIHQLHLLGGDDRNIPPDIVLNEIRRQGADSHYYIFDKFTHAGPWNSVWASVLGYIEGRLSESGLKQHAGFAGKGPLQSVFGP